MLLLPECAGEPTAILRAFLEGDRSDRLGERLCIETRPMRTAAQLAVWWAMLVITHVLIPDP